MNDFKFHTQPFKHQEESFYKYRDREYHATLWEQRTGKSKLTLDVSSYLYSKGQATGLLIIAPNGVHLGWARNEIPLHMAPHIGCEPVVWNSTPNVTQRKELDRLINNSTSLGLRCLCMNIESLRSEKGRTFALQFMRNFRTILVLDEGSTIKNPTAQQTKYIIGDRGKKGLNVHAPFRRLLNGTLITNSPLDAWSQMAFLDDYILGPSFVTFRNRYAVIEMQGRMQGEVKKKLEIIAGRFGAVPWGDIISSDENGVITSGQQPLDEGCPIDFSIKQCGRMAYKLDWRCGKAGGSETMIFQPGQTYPVVTGYRHLDELQRKIAPWSDRVLKADCLDLPEKVYQKRYVELSKKQAVMYAELKEECITECKGQQMSAGLAIVKMLRLQQIVGGFYVPDDIQVNDEEEVILVLDRKAIPIDDDNLRIEALMEDISLSEGKVIIWARFVAEIQAITSALRQRYGKDPVEELYGQIPSDKRQNAIDRFQTLDNPRFLVANPACKGVSRGQNMCRAVDEYYYSNSFSLEDRLQSEDRPHSPGQTKNLGVIDMVCLGTLDEKVIDALRSKKELAREVSGDRLMEWI